MLKRFGLWVVFLCVLTIGISAHGQTTSTKLAPITVFINEKPVTLDLQPIVSNNRTMVPLRGIFESLGANVDWNQYAHQAIVSSGTNELVLESNNTIVLKNGRIQYLDAPSITKNDRLMVPLRYIAESFGHKVQWNPKTRQINITTNAGLQSNVENQLPTLKDAKALTSLLKYSQNLNAYFNQRFMFTTGVVQELAPPTLTDTNAPSSATTEGKATSDYSGTNNQTEGVDEGDLVKTNGTHIFTMINNSVHIIDSNPLKPEILSTITLSNDRGTITDIYIKDHQLVIIGSGSHYSSPYTSEPLLMPQYKIYNVQMNTIFMQYDITNPSKPTLVKDLEYDGYYVTSRLIDDKFYMVTNKTLPLYGLQDSLADPTTFDQVTLPSYTNRLTKVSHQLSYKEVQYFPDYITPNITMTIGIDLNSQATDVQSYLGSANIVYASLDHLYLAFTKYTYSTEKSTQLFAPNYSQSTSIYKFALSNGTITYKAQGSVPGTVVNQFSMDDYMGNLRIATTTGEMWNPNNESKNNVYILDPQLQALGQLTGLAPGEKIYSTRFANERIYMVTYRQVDPFFVIDASDPTSPKVLGDLKIPGFSTYMHILDQNHVLGFGMDTNEVDGRITTGGFKLSLFDVTDPTKPIEKSKEVIGTTGTYSELSYNHKSLMMSLSKGIMGFPISIASQTPYVTDFIGAYVYNVSANSFSYKGNVTHKAMTNTASQDVYSNTLPINRLLYIGDYLYSFSSGRMEIHSLNDMTYVSGLAMPIATTDSTTVNPSSTPLPLPLFKE